MKTNKILSTLAAGLLLLAGACQDKISYDPAQVYHGDEVYFDIAEIGELDIETDAVSVSFNLYRVDTSKDITVGLESSVTNPSGEDVSDIFGVPSQVTFPAGQAVVEVPVSVLFEAVTPEMDYNMVVKIEGESLTPYGATVADFTLKYGTKYEPWAEYLAGQYATFQMAGPWNYLYEASLYFHKSINMPHKEQYKIEDPFSDVDWEYVMTVDHSMPLTIEGEEGDCYLVTMDDIDTTVEVDDDGNTLCWRDVYTFVKYFLISVGVDNPTPERILAVAANNNFQVAYINETTGSIKLSLIGQPSNKVGTDSYYPSWGGVQVIQLPGFKTYDVMAYDAGYSVDATGVETKRFALYKTADTPEMKYAMYKGTLTEEEVDAKEEELLADEDSEVITENEYYVSFELEPGDYTLLVIGIDNEEVMASVAKSFSYTPANHDGFVTVGTVKYTDGFMNSLPDEGFSTVTLDVELQQNPEMPGIYRLKNAYRVWGAETGNEDMVMSGNYYITINAEDANLVYIEECNLGVRHDAFQGPVYGYSKAAQALAEGMKPATIKLRKLNGTLKNGVISFPASTLLVAYMDQLPDFMEANTLSSFKVDLNTLTKDEAPIRGTRVRSFGAPVSTLQAPRGPEASIRF